MGGIIFLIQYLAKEDIPSVLALDAKVYAKEYQVSAETSEQEWKRNPYTVLTVLNDGCLVGYISLCPIPEKVFAQIIKGGFSEEQIEKSVLPSSHKGSCYAYLSSIVVDKEHYPYYKGRYLIEYLQEHLTKMRKRGTFFNQIVALAVSPMGKKTLDKMRFTEIKPNLFIYSCVRQGIRFIIEAVAHERVPTLLSKGQEMVFSTLLETGFTHTWAWDRDT